MIFRTELEIDQTDFRIHHRQKIVSMGSCFADEMGERLNNLKFKTLQNPFGILFHPSAMESALARIHSRIRYTESEIFNFEEVYFSWDHHSSFSNVSLKSTLNGINEALDYANEFMRDADVFLLTFGTSWVYKIKELNVFVANCHKVPSRHFEKVLLTDSQIKSAIRNCFDLIKDISPRAKILVSISPVRHTKDGIIENSISKAKLINGLHDVIAQYENIDYFPAYEFMMDDLRDYRFYKEDLTHPNSIALNYIWEKFSNVYFSKETEGIINEVEKINQALQHKPYLKETISYRKFLYNTMKKIEDLGKKLPYIPFETELQKLKETIRNAD